MRRRSRRRRTWTGKVVQEPGLKKLYIFWHSNWNFNCREANKLSLFQQVNLCSLKYHSFFHFSFLNIVRLMWGVFSKVRPSLKPTEQPKLTLLQAICSWCHWNFNHKNVSKRKHFHLLIRNPADRKSWHPQGNTFVFYELGNLHVLFKWTKRKIWKLQFKKPYP
jgi:hypothetical protein